ncbi:unnamed protein product [Pleuronectes platessa]|uniref:Uncharacterized protein n=1 Tax=Pleuronectes platessa TaxID=8262 RepID=A0A9N7UNQ0_PLEPL|nr:unnamed protein product [Pleuronectes platessa]
MTPSGRLSTLSRGSRLRGSPRWPYTPEWQCPAAALHWRGGGGSGWAAPHPLEEREERKDKGMRMKENYLQDSDPSVDHNHHDSHHPPHLDAGLLQLHRMQRPGDCDSASSRDIYSRIHCHTDL